MTSAGRPPVIIIGMHRSGTSMLSKLLEGLGLFVGSVKQWNHESPFFQILNEWILRRCGATYKTPRPLLEFLADPQKRAATAATLHRALDSPWSLLYSGPLNFLKFRRPKTFPFPWGWKDPRSTVTLPVWLDVFPDAKIVHIYRHGVDVANSLRNRRRRRLNRLIALCEEAHLKRRDPDCDVASLHTRRLLTLMGGFSLWEEYLIEARRHIAALSDRAIEVRYEDFMSSPAGKLKELAAFCGLSPTDADVDRVTAKIRTHRACAHRNVPELSEFARTVAERLEVHGY